MMMYAFDDENVIPWMDADALHNLQSMGRGHK
jgi:hypothetical protein